MRMKLIVWLINSMKDGITGEDIEKIFIAISNHIPPYVALEMYDMRNRYDSMDNMDEADMLALDAAHTSYKKPVRMLN